MPRQMEIPELDPANDEAILREAWRHVPRVRPEDYERQIQLPFVRACLVRVARARLSRRKHGNSRTNS